VPRIRLIAGPNGAGKTTLLRTLVARKVPIGQYINPDDIARHIDLPRMLDRTSEGLGSKAKSHLFNENFSNYFRFCSRR